jgi:hypothetical protein
MTDKPTAFDDVEYISEDSCSLGKASVFLAYQKRHVWAHLLCVSLGASLELRLDDMLREGDQLSLCKDAVISFSYLVLHIKVIGQHAAELGMAKTYVDT